MSEPTLRHPTAGKAQPTQLPWPAPETRVRDWDELLIALHSPALIPVQAGQGGHHRSPFVFRGMSDAEWPLQTSLERLGTPPDHVEHALLRSFHN